MQEAKPVISIVGTIYNQAELAERTLDVWCRQDFDLPYEIIVLDDGSTDGTREMVERMDAKYPGLIRYFYFNEPELIRNCTLLFNTAIRRFARADIICVQWYDRIPSTFDALNRLYRPHLDNDKAFISFQHRHIAGSSSRDVIDNDALDALMESVQWREDPMRLTAIMGEPGAHCYPEGMNESACFSFNKKHFFAIGGYDERYFRVANYSNIELWGRFKAYGLDFTITDDFTFHQPHPANRAQIQTQLEPDEVLERNANIRQDYGHILTEAEVADDACEWTLLVPQYAPACWDVSDAAIQVLRGADVNGMLARATGRNVLYVADPTLCDADLLKILPELAKLLAQDKTGCVGPAGGTLLPEFAWADSAEEEVQALGGAWIAFARKPAVRNALRIADMCDVNLSVADFSLQMGIWGGRTARSLNQQTGLAVPVNDSFIRRWDFLTK